ncbi:condensation domain-containing protein [Pseudomonas japonica]|uniref:Mycobactin phenyloxazoline synthetase n=1 Tax=Pseudomonas japonica TaxID=256466 RepID=A0A239KVC5_9PSED|nr:AMP-binding protein [Pseudomonas japonica]SNT21995.1 mycobactin phenyloxazoline synthetase [Pseudomonas japonica]
MDLHEEVTRQVSLSLQLEDGAVACDSNLIEYGLHSLKIMELVGLFEGRYNRQLSFADFAMAPTIGEWVKLLEQPVSEPVLLDSASRVSSLESTQAPVALSEMQYAYWAGRQAGGASAHLYVEFTGQGIDPQRLQGAFSALLARHPMLRVIITADGQQQIAHELDAQVGVDDLRTHLPRQARALQLRKRQAMSGQKLDVARGQVIDISLTLLPGGQHCLHIDMDMIAADAESYLLALEDLARLYLEGSSGLASQPVGGSYFDYLEHLRSDPRRQQTLADDQHWWQARLPGFPEPPELPLVAEGLRHDPERFDSRCHVFSVADKAVLEGLADRCQVPLASLLLTLFALTLTRWSSSPRFRLNLPSFLRLEGQDVEGTIGDFSRFVLLDVDMAADRSLQQACQRMHQEWQHASRHAAYPGVQVLRDLSRLHKQTETAPIVFTPFGMERTELFSEQVGAAFGEPSWCLSQGPKVDLDAQVAALHGGLLVNWDIRQAAFRGTSALQMFDHYITALRGLIEQGPALDRLPDSSATEAAAQPDHATLTAGEVPPGLLELFVRQVGHNPDATALVHGGKQLSYRALSLEAGSIARRLSDLGVKTGDTVALCLDDGVSMIAAIFATWSLGAAYVPVTTAQLPTWLASLQCSCVITDCQGVQAPAIGLIDLSIQQQGAMDELTLTAAALTRGGRACLLPVQPAGSAQELIDLSQAALGATLQGLINVCGTDRQTVLLSLSGINSDLLLADLCLTLATGGQLVLAGSQPLATLMRSAGVNALHGTTGQVIELATSVDRRELSQLSRVLCARDAVPQSLWAHLLQAGSSPRLISLQGSVHTGIYSAFSVADADDAWVNGHLPHGQPLGRSRCLILDSQMRECPDWVMGQLLVGGPGLAEGAGDYIRHQGERWYRTGVLAYRDERGQIVLHAPAHARIKYQGYLVDTDAVAALIQSIPGVSLAKVCRIQHKGVPALAALIVPVPTAQGQARTQELRIRQALEALPRNLGLRHFQFSERVPLTADGLINLATLVERLQADAQRHASGPVGSALEQAVSHVFAKMLGSVVDQVSLEDDFFDLGGDSLLATHLVVALNRYFRGAELTVVDVFAARSAKGVAAQLAERLPGTADKIAAVFLKVVGGVQ